MPVTSSTFVRTTIALLMVGLVALIGIVGTSLWLAQRTTEFSDTVIDLQGIRREAFRLMSFVQDAESGQRGYLLTLEDVYLEPYRTALVNIDKQSEAVRQAVAARPSYRGFSDRLDPLIRAKIAELQETIDLAASGRREEALAIVRTDRGELAMQAIRDTVEDFVRSVDDPLRASAAATQRSASALIWVLSIGGAMILLVVGGSTWVAWRYTRDLERARTEVIALNAGLEERVRERTSDLARANEEIQRFAYIVSHDLRAPLVNIMGFTSELEMGLASLRSHFGARAPADGDEPAAREARLALDTEMPEAIGFIRSSTGRMDNLISAILKLSREGARKLTRQHIDMKALLDTAADSMRHQISEGGGEIVVRTGVPDIVSDRLALEQVFGNLVDNAVKYLDSKRPGRIVISGAETHNGLVYEVADNGRGIGRDDHERVFELFRRAGSQDRPGEGIGLSHVRALVRRLGGDIELESELGRGTTFRVRLPRSPPILRESA